MSTRFPDILEPADTWRNQAACRTEDPDLFFPDGHSDRYAFQIDEAKAVCRRCPVVEICATKALDRREDFGVWGGLDETDRRRIYRRHASQLANPTFLTSVVQAALTPKDEPSLQDVYDQRTVKGEDGHVMWTVKNHAFSVGGVIYTPMQVAFILAHDRRPNGMVRTICGVGGCVAFDHITDTAMRKAARRAAAA